jgi:hypothetical protein
MSALGQKRPFRARLLHVRFAPLADIGAAGSVQLGWWHFGLGKKRTRLTTAVFEMASLGCS